MAIIQGNITTFNRMHGGSSAPNLDAGTGADRMVMFVCTHASNTVSTWTYNAVGLSTFFINQAVGAQRTSVGFLLNPASGTNQCVLSFSTQARNTAIGIMYQNCNQAEPLSSWQVAATSNTMPRSRTGQWVMSGGSCEYIGDSYEGSATYGTPVYVAGSQSDGSISVRLNLYKMEIGHESVNNVLGFHAQHATVSWSFLMHPQSGGGNKSFIVGMMRKWKQYMNELLRPSLYWDLETQKFVQIYPSKLRTDIDPYIREKRFRELVSGKAY